MLGDFNSEVYRILNAALVLIQAVTQDKFTIKNAMYLQSYLTIYLNEVLYVRFKNEIMFKAGHSHLES